MQKRKLGKSNLEVSAVGLEEAILRRSRQSTQSLRRFGKIAARNSSLIDSVNGASTHGQFLRDLRYSARLLSQNLTFTSAVVLLLAIGVGAQRCDFQLNYNCRARSSNCALLLPGAINQTPGQSLRPGDAWKLIAYRRLPASIPR